MVARWWRKGKNGGEIVSNRNPPDISVTVFESGGAVLKWPRTQILMVKDQFLCFTPLFCQYSASILPA